MGKIILTEDIMNESFAKNATIDTIMAKAYEAEIADRIKSNPKFENMTPLKIAMFDAGISGKSIINDFTTSGASEWLLPAFIDTRLRETVAGNSMLSYVSTMTSGIDGLTVLGATLDLVNDVKNKDAAKMKRVAEGADLPLAKFGLSESSIRLYKRGRAVEATYEALKYLRVDLFAKAIDSIANDVADQQMGDAISVIVAGDGNDNAITTLATTATADLIVVDDLLNAIIAFQTKAKKPITTLLADIEFFKQLYKMTYKTDEVSGAEMRFMINTPQYSAQEVNLIFDERVPLIGGKKAVLMLNKDDALVKYLSNGSEIRELSKNIRNQTQLGTISETANFGKFNKNSCGALVSK